MLYTILTAIFTQVWKSPSHSHVTYHMWNIVILHTILTTIFTQVWKSPLCSHVTYHLWNIVILCTILTAIFTVFGIVYCCIKKTPSESVLTQLEWFNLLWAHALKTTSVITKLFMHVCKWSKILYLAQFLLDLLYLTWNIEAHHRDMFGIVLDL